MAAKCSARESFALIWTSVSLIVCRKWQQLAIVNQTSSDRRTLTKLAPEIRMIRCSFGVRCLHQRRTRRACENSSSQSSWKAQSTINYCVEASKLLFCVLSGTPMKREQSLVTQLYHYFITIIRSSSASSLSVVVTPLSARVNSVKDDQCCLIQFCLTPAMGTMTNFNSSLLSVSSSRFKDGGRLKIAA